MVQRSPQVSRIRHGRGLAVSQKHASERFGVSEHWRSPVEVATGKTCLWLSQNSSFRSHATVCKKGGYTGGSGSSTKVPLPQGLKQNVKVRAQRQVTAVLSEFENSGGKKDLQNVRNKVKELYKRSGGVHIQEENRTGWSGSRDGDERRERIESGGMPAEESEDWETNIREWQNKRQEDSSRNGGTCL